jgi:mono/diheme cytochrome c family protein
MHIGKASGAILAASAALMMALGGWAQDKKGKHVHPPGTPAHTHVREPIRISSDELHRHGGVPPGWRFTLPEGDAEDGRAVFAKLECYQCHTIRGERFPQSSPPPGVSAGPELTGMGDRHPAEYFAESILNPNAVITTEPGYTGADGLSIMPDYRDSLSAADLIDLVAYLKSLQGGHDHGGSGAKRKQHKHPMPPEGGHRSKH